MKLLLIADGRSPITRRWIAMLQPLGYQIILISSYPCEPVEGLVRLYTLPLAFAAQGGAQGTSGNVGFKKKLVSKFRPMLHTVRHLLGPWMVSFRKNKYLNILKIENPDLIHALRIPFEGMLASFTPPGIPVIVSTWGNDLTLHAPSTLKMASMTRQTLRRANGLFSDTKRDIRLANHWGFDIHKPSLGVPGNGGLDLDELQTVTKGIKKVAPPLVINPRGFRPASVRNDTFFKAIPLVLAQRPEISFSCAFMAGQAEALAWVKKLNIEKNVNLLPYLTQAELWKEFARSQISLSISEHDGTPNSLLEAMAVGCLPICGDIESIRQWIMDGENGILVDPADPEALAEAILRSLDNREIQENAAAKNLQIIKQLADIKVIREQVKVFYAQFN
jgi:glycosyltransferase involved in cell wall biosynthesis